MPNTKGVLSLHMEYLVLDQEYLSLLLKVPYWRVYHLNLYGFDRQGWRRLANALGGGGGVECVIVSQHALHPVFFWPQQNQ